MRKMGPLEKSGLKDGGYKEKKLFNINYEKMLRGYDKLGHMKKLSVPFDMSKIKSRDMSMMMSTEAYKNILYDNYKLECQEMFAS